MKEEPATLDATIAHRVHPGLSLEVALRLGADRGIVFGPSGAGKTTLLRLIAGLDRPDEGTIRVGETVWFDSATRTHLAMRSRRVGMIFQDDLLFPHLSVEANIRFGLHHETRSASQRRTREVADLCGVSHLLARRPGTLSGGERQRVGLARALAPRPRVLLCDEPVSAIDLDGRFALVDRLRAIHEVERMPLLYVTHSPAEAIALGTTLWRVSEGKIVDQGPPLDVLARRPDRGGSTRLDDVRNLIAGEIVGHAADRGETTVKLAGGPSLVVPYHGREPGTPVTVSIRADDILLSRHAITGLSARNVVPGTVARVVPHGGDAEVVVTTGETLWIASVVGSAVDALDLGEGSEVHLVLKARSCHVSSFGPPPG